jgi:hypothetical protein
MIDAALNTCIVACPNSIFRRCATAGACDVALPNTLCRLGWQKGLLEYLNAALPQFPDPSRERNSRILIRRMANDERPKAETSRQRPGCA